MLLEKLLQKLSESHTEAQTTNSQYYQVGNVVVRLSDHFSYNSKAQLQIIVPSNNVSLYSVFMGSSSKMYIMKYTEIKNNIESWINVLSLTTPNFKTAKEPVKEEHPNIPNAYPKPPLQMTGDERGVINSILISKKVVMKKGDSKRVVAKFDKVGIDFQGALKWIDDNVKKGWSADVVIGKIK